MPTSALDESYIIEAEQRARRFQGAWTGTAGTLAADVIRLIKERQGRMAVRIIGFAGPINSGKSAAAAMIPEAVHLQWADAIYRGLAAMFGVPEEVLRDRRAKDEPLNLAGLTLTPRALLQTLGTEWGRDAVAPDLWVRLTLNHVDRLASLTGRTVFSICGTRFPNEVAAIRSRGGEVWWIDRPVAAAVATHPSEHQINVLSCDRVIVNDGTMDDLRRRVESEFAAFLRT